jgi:hypothetical protein
MKHAGRYTARMGKEDCHDEYEPAIGVARFLGCGRGWDVSPTVYHPCSGDDRHSVVGPGFRRGRRRLVQKRSSLTTRGQRQYDRRGPESPIGIAKD